MRNKLLQNQLDLFLKDKLRNDKRLSLFLNAVEDTYNHFQNAVNEKEESTISKLNDSLKILNPDYQVVEQAENHGINVIEIAEMIFEECCKRNSIEIRYKENLNRLEKINRELDQFAYIVSHDLKAPLRAIASLADWIREDSAEELTTESKQNLELLRGRVTRMESLIHGILAYSKAGKIRTEKKIVNINQMINEIVDSFTLPSNITIELPGDLPSIETEEIKLQQVFGNLISNSIKYMDKDTGIINIGWLRLEDKFQFYVEDNGPGIEREYHDRVFMIFQTLSARDHIESTGIGLSIVKKIIEEQGGKIWIESVPGTGSKFIFTWSANMNLINKSVA